MKLILTIFVFISAGIVYANFEKDTSLVSAGNEEVSIIDSCVNCTVLDSAVGIASYYGKRHHGKKMADGKIFNMNDLTASHNKYPFGTIIRVTNLSNKLNVILKITDRLHIRNTRIIDMSQKAAELLGMIRKGIGKVKIEVLRWGDS